MEILKAFGASAIVLSLIFFIASRMITTSNYIRKSLYMFLVGLLLLAFFAGGIIFDIVNYYYQNYFDSLGIGYFAAPIITFGYTIGYFLFYYLKGNKLHQKFRSIYAKQKKQERTIKDKTQFLFLIYKYKNTFLLKKEERNKEKEIFYTCQIIKFPRKEFFHDELINQLIKKENLDVQNYILSGVATHPGKKDDVYYCYTIELESLTLELRTWDMVAPNKLISLAISDFDRKIIYTSQIEKDFNITI